jgi:hypothetical protein
MLNIARRNVDYISEIAKLSELAENGAGHTLRSEFGMSDLFIGYDYRVSHDGCIPTSRIMNTIHPKAIEILALYRQNKEQPPRVMVNCGLVMQGSLWRKTTCWDGLINDGSTISSLLTSTCDEIQSSMQTGRDPMECVAPLMDSFSLAQSCYTGLQTRRVVDHILRNATADFKYGLGPQECVIDKHCYDDKVYVSDAGLYRLNKGMRECCDKYNDKGSQFNGFRVGNCSTDSATVSTSTGKSLKMYSFSMTVRGDTVYVKNHSTDCSSLPGRFSMQILDSGAAIITTNKDDAATAEAALDFVKDLQADPKRFLEIGKLIGNCIVCGRDISASSSLERGMGAVCFEKHGTFSTILADLERSCGAMRNIALDLHMEKKAISKPWKHTMLAYLKKATSLCDLDESDGFTLEDVIALYPEEERLCLREYVLFMRDDRVPCMRSHADVIRVCDKVGLDWKPVAKQLCDAMKNLRMQSMCVRLPTEDELLDAAVDAYTASERGGKKQRV